MPHRPRTHTGLEPRPGTHTSLEPQTGRQGPSRSATHTCEPCLGQAQRAARRTEGAQAAEARLRCDGALAAERVLQAEA
eukprot:scaffold60417_cov54-Phaeocystis_antarctica.AAC.4